MINQAKKQFSAMTGTFARQYPTQMERVNTLEMDSPQKLIGLQTVVRDPNTFISRNYAQLEIEKNIQSNQR